MGKSLIIVESPTKIKTLKKFLGSKYLIESSVGHIRDLPTKGFGIDVENDFEPQYETLPEKKDVISKLKKAAKEAETVYLAPDPDREGEAIAWHIANILPPNTKFKRVSFNAITKQAVLSALAEPREINQALVDAQQARRLLDRIVGYKISPILQRKINRGKDGFLSAGRVQSVALKMVVDREKEIEAFNPVEYWTIHTKLQTSSDAKPFHAQLYLVDGKRIEKEPVPGKDLFIIPSEEVATSLVDRLKKGKCSVEKLQKKEKKRNPVPPFITSTLQQEASRHYGFSAQRTMGIAQSLYEGVDLGEQGAEGLITYMRTDSVRVAPEGIAEARSYIAKRYGQEYLPEKPKVYASKAGSQDAHEAIRPTSCLRSPEEINQYLTRDQQKIYLLIWRRYLAAQMNPAIYDTVTVDIDTKQNLTLRASGSVIKFKGFLAVYEEKRDDDKDDDKENILPPMNEGQALNLLDIDPQQSFTRPPPRFTEASLVKEMEKQGIGRPSTYASIMNKIQSRDYTEKERLTLKPTELGRIISQMLETSFKDIMDIQFTAKMERQLDEIAEHHQDWKGFIRNFWEGFIPQVDTAAKEAHVPKLETDILCPNCKKGKLQKIWSRNKYFYGCNNYPECKFTSPIEALNFNKDDYAENFDWEQKCPLCNKDMLLRHGRFGPFLGCTAYPDCKGIVNIPKKGEPLLEDMADCPAIGCPGKIQMRRSRFGKNFFSCSTYPECDVIANSPEELIKKYPDHPRTAYIKKKKGTKKGAKKGAKKPAAKKKENNGAK